MTSTTPNYGYTLYDRVTDASAVFLDFRGDIAGAGETSNFEMIDEDLDDLQTLIDALEDKKFIIRVPMVYTSANQYVASGITEMPATPYPTGTTIVVIPDTTNDGTLALNIDGDGNQSLMKKNTSGTSVNLDVGDLVINRAYMFMYDGTNWIWVGAQSSDQIHVVSGSAGNLIKVSSGSALEDAGFFISDPGTSGNILIDDGNDWISASALPVGMKASGSDIDTGTDDEKFVTAKSLKDSVNIPNVAPGTSGNMLVSSGSAWINSTPQISNASSEGVFVSSDGDVTVTLGDTLGVRSLTVKDSSGSTVTIVDSTGTIYTSRVRKQQGSVVSVTIASDTLDFTSAPYAYPASMYNITGEGGAADDLSKILPHADWNDGLEITLWIPFSASAITVKNNTGSGDGKLFLGADFVLSDWRDTITFVLRGVAGTPMWLLKGGKADNI